MQKNKDGGTRAPEGKMSAVCAPGEFPVGVIGLEHGHIFGMCNGLKGAGAVIDSVYDPDPEKVKNFLKSFPEARAAESEDDVLRSSARLIATAAVPADRAGIAVRAMEAGKDVFADKPPVITPAQLEQAEAAAARTGGKMFVYFSERLNVEAAVYAERLLRDGAIGRVIQVMGWGPHRLNEPTRPEWFFDPSRYGGIITDIGCHQIEQLMFFAGASDAEVLQSRVGNLAHPDHPGLEDFGDCMIQCDNGVAGYFRVDWFTPDGLGTWGDGRTLIVGTGGTIEIRKYIDLAGSREGNHVYYVDQKGEHHVCVTGQCGFPFFGRLIRDCLDRTETAMTQEHIFRVLRVTLKAQINAMRIRGE